MAPGSRVAHERDTVDVCDRELEIGVDGKHLGRVSWSDHVEEGLRRDCSSQHNLKRDEYSRRNHDRP
jgi:hypothetical protein